MSSVDDSRLLSELCSCVCCSQTPPTEPATCCDILLSKYDTRENVLLQLSAIRGLYHSCTQDDVKIANDTDISANFWTFSSEVVKCLSLKLPILYRLLCASLDSTDQYVCFCASKALVSVFIYTGVKEHMITDIFTKLQTQVYSHGGIYCLQTIRELLKSLRKRLHTADSARGQLLQSTSECTYSFCHDHYWLSTLELLLTESLDVSERRKLGLTVGEFFSLTVELLRYKHERSSSVVTTPDSLSQCIITNLSRALSLVKRCGDEYILKRFVDMALKTEQKANSLEFIKCIPPVLETMLGISICKKTLHCWMEENVQRLLLESSYGPQAKRDILHHQQQKNEVVHVLIRKIILLVVKIISVLLCNHSQKKLQPDTGSGDLSPVSHDTLTGVVTSISDLLSSCVSLDGRGDLSMQQCTSAFYQVVSEEDDCLIHVLAASTAILRHSTNLPYIPGLKTILAVINAHSLWLCFLLNISFDHSVLLDLLLSPEIDFTPALQDYLTLVTNDWKNFEIICSDYDQLVHYSSTMDCVGERMGTSSRRQCKDLRFGENPVLVDQSLQLHVDPKEQGEEKEHQPMSALVDYSSSSSEDETGDSSKHDALLPSSIEASVDNAVYTSSTTDDGLKTFSPQDSEHAASSDQESMLEVSLSTSPESSLSRVMGCLIRLRMSLERLSSSGLLPLQSAGTELVTAIESVEELYETQCGDS